MEMAENWVPENAYVVSVMQMIDPSTFWVTKSPENVMTEERNKLDFLEEMLLVQSQRSFQGVNCVPKEGELVAVQHPETDCWHRAKVECRLHVAKGRAYKVFLVDYGVSVEVCSSAIRELPETSDSLDYQAFQVVLYGVVPTTVGMDYRRSKMEREVASGWMPAAVTFVEGLLENSTKAWFVEKKNIKKKLYGDLFLELTDESLSLSNELCSKEHAVMSEELFEEALKSCNVQQEQQFSRTPSPQSPGCHLSNMDQSTSRDHALGDYSKRLSIRGYVHKRSIHQAKKEEKNQNQTEEWRREGEAGHVDEHGHGDSVQSDKEEILGHGMLIQKSKVVSPGVCSKLTMANVEQAGKCNESSSSKASHEGETKPSSQSPVLQLLHLIGNSNYNSKSMNEPVTSWTSLCAGKKNLSVEYFPAGSDLNVANKKSKDARRIKNKPVLNEGKCASVRNDSPAVPVKTTNNCYTASDIILSQSTNVPLDTARNEVQSSVIKNSEHCNVITMKKQQTLMSSLQCQQTPTNSVSESVSCRTEGIGGVPCVIAEKEKTSVPTRNVLQVIAVNVGKSTQARRQKMLDGLNNNTLSPISTPDMKASQPKAALEPVLKQEVPGNCTQVKSVNSLASVEGVLLPTEQFTMVRERRQTSRILVHGDMEFGSVRSVAEANFPREIHQALARMEFKDPMRIQTYAWPAILRGQYTVLVGPPQSGKTLSYIIPLVSFMLDPDLYSELQPGNGPLALVLCSGSRSAQFVYEKCCTLLKFSDQNKIRVEIAYGGGRERELREPLANGCDILISTPPCFKRLMRFSRFITNVDRLAYLVLDEVDILAQKFPSELKEIITECKQMLVRRTKVGVPVQVIAASEKWCPAVEQFLQHISQNFLVCISGYLEAAVYAKLQPSLYYLSADSKPQAVLDILDGYQGQYKTVIICQSAAEVDEFVPFLESQCFHVLAAHEQKTSCHNIEICQRWKCSVVPGVHPVLVCTDDVLPELDVTDAMWLIHYSLPHTKTGFGFRFSCLMKNYPNLFHMSASEAACPECKVHILVDKDQNIKELPEIVRFLKRLSVSVAPDIEAKAKEIVHQKESEKLGAPLCYYVKAFGECMERSICRSRHIILDTADKPGIPTRGEVKVKILHVHNASSFSARLLEHTDVGGCPVSIRDEYFTVNMAVYSHYSDERNRSLRGIPKLGDICSLESKINFFQRVQVVGIMKEDTRGIPEEVQVKFLDEGTFAVVKVYQLLALPEVLQQLPPQVVDIFLCNVMPCDLDTSWSETATCRMNDWINNINSREEDGKFLVGKVMLSVGSTLWLEPLECCSYLPSLGKRVRELSLSKELVNCKLAVKNPHHLDKLYELCRAGGLGVPSYEKAVKALEKVQSKIQTLPSPQWAHLDNETFQPIISYSVENPHLLFIRQYKFHDVFQKFVHELQKCVKTKPEDFHLEKGTYCLGKFPDDGLWCRARVDQMLEGDCALLFFVDYGDNASVHIDDIAPITEMQIKKLPFQAIECSLAGIKSPVGGTWSEEATDVVCEFADNSHGLYVKVCEVVNTAVCTGGKKYNVVLVDVGTGTDVYLNKVLVERNLAVPDNIEEILEKLAPVHSEADDISEKSDMEPEEEQTVQLSDIKVFQPAALPSAEGSLLDEGEFEFVIDDLPKFLGLSNNCQPTLPALPLSNEHSTEESASSCISSQAFLSDDEGDDIDCMPPLLSTTRTPQVLWHQDDCIIYIKIMLTGVQKYYIGWDTMHLQFSTEINSQVYEVMLDLYGPIDVSSITHTAEGFFVHIKMMKIVTGCHWTRLLHSQCRQSWLKPDLENYKGDCDSDEDNVKTRCDRALKELSSPCKKSHNATTNWKDKASMCNVHISSEEEEEEEEDDDDDDDAVDQQYELYDPYDPLS